MYIASKKSFAIMAFPSNDAKNVKDYEAHEYKVFTAFTLSQAYKSSAAVFVQVACKPRYAVTTLKSYKKEELESSTHNRQSTIDNRQSTVVYNRKSTASTTDNLQRSTIENRQRSTIDRGQWSAINNDRASRWEAMFCYIFVPFRSQKDSTRQCSIYNPCTIIQNSAVHTDIVSRFIFLDVLMLLSRGRRVNVTCW